MSDNQPQFSRRHLLVAVLGFGSVGALASITLPAMQALARDAGAPLPVWASADPRTARAYHAALRRADLLGQLNCYCGCMTSASLMHTSLRDCYLHADGTFEAHASGCELCVDEALSADLWASSNLSVAAIQQRTDETYGQLGCTTKRCVE